MNQTPEISSVSLKNLLSEKTVAGNAVKETVTEQHKPEDAVLDREVHEADLQKAWKEYASKIIDEKPHVHSILVNRIPLLKNAVEIKVELISQSQETEFLKEKELLLSFLKTKLRNSKLRLFTVISVENSNETVSAAVTPKDKLKVMMTKNPAMIKLLNDFNLDIE